MKRRKIDSRGKLITALARAKKREKESLPVSLRNFKIIFPRAIFSPFVYTRDGVITKCRTIFERELRGRYATESVQGDSNNYDRSK